MMFQDQHGLESDGVAGADTWDALMEAAIADERNSAKGYNYVHVSESLPEKVFLWHNGKTIFNVPGNTGIPGAETELGTFPVYLRYEETTMSGENPDGSHYEDPGIKWVSYFNGGDALHAFDRASYGSPQSLGCVEMQLEDAGKDLALHADRHPGHDRTLSEAVDTHGRWPWGAAALVGPSWGMVLARRGELGRDDAWVAALGLPILVAHQTEEWVRPGGFLPFCNERLLGSEEPAWPLTERLGFHVNVTMGWGSAVAAAALLRRGRIGCADGTISGEATAEIAAAIGDVYAVAADAEGAPRWQPEIELAECLERDGAGNQLRVRVKTETPVKTITSLLVYTYRSPTLVTWKQEEGDLKAVAGSWELESLAAARPSRSTGSRSTPGGCSASPCAARSSTSCAASWSRRCRASSRPSSRPLAAARLAPGRRHHRARAAVVAVLAEVDPLPGPERRPALAHRQGQRRAQQRRLDVGGHVVLALQRVGPVRRPFRHRLVEPGLEVAPHFRRGVLAQRQRGRGVLDQQVQHPDRDLVAAPAGRRAPRR